MNSPLALRLLLLGLLGGTALSMPGCVVWEIRNDLRKANTQLQDVQGSLKKLDTTNESLDKTNAQLEHTSKLINEVEQGLGRIDTTNNGLSSLDKQLAILKQIETSLGHLDQHLAALRRTIGRIDSAIPFLDLGGGEAPPEAAPSATAAADAQPAGAADAAAASKPADPVDPSKRDAVLGTWLSQFPQRGLAVVLQADGKFLWTDTTLTSNPPVTMTGKWKKLDSKTLQLTADPVPAPANAPAATGGPAPATGSAANATAPTAAAAPSTWQYQIVAQTTRSITLQQDGVIRVWTHP
jgi:hypothetical protein